MESLIDIGKNVIPSYHGFHVQSMIDAENVLTINLLQDYLGEFNQYKLIFGEIIYCEFIDEHISAPRFRDKIVFEGVVFEVVNSSLLLFYYENSNNDKLYHYFIRSSLYYIEIISKNALKIEQVDLKNKEDYIL